MANTPISIAPIRSWMNTYLLKYRASKEKETINAMLLNAEAVPYFTIVRDKLNAS
jgi:hypothetical protein